MSTRADLIAAAQDLFIHRGFKKTSVNAIVEAAGVSKGAFYHHFESKMGLVNALIEDISLRRLEEIRPVVEDETIWSIDKLNGFITQGREWRMKNIKVTMEMITLAHRDDNIVIHQRMNARVTALFAPFLAEIIRQGIREDQFSVSDPDETALLLLHTGQTLGHLTTEDFLDLEPTEENIDRQKRRVDAFFIAFERILGAPEGSITREPRSYIERIFAEVQRWK